MQEPQTIAVEPAGLTLEALWRDAGERSGVVAPPHPLYGGAMSNPVVEEISAALAASDVSTLCFNWRGVGASTGGPSGELEHAREDYLAATAALQTRRAAPFVAAGYSFGAATAMLVAAGDARFDRLLLVAPPVAMAGEELAACVEAISCPVHVIVGANDQFAPTDDVRAMVAKLDDATLDVIAGVDHFFAFSGTHELGEHVVERLGSHGG